MYLWRREGSGGSKEVFIHLRSGYQPSFDLLRTSSSSCSAIAFRQVISRLRIGVVGGGVIGLACAWRLAADGHQVVVFDGAPEAREASWAAAGMLAPHHEATSADAVWRLGASSLARWPTFAAALGVDLDLHLQGGLLPLIDAGDETLLQEKLSFATSQGLSTRQLDADELKRIEPHLAARGALLLPGGHVDPRRLTTALRQACEQRGVELRYGSAVSAILPGGIQTRDALERCDLTVLANGAWTPALARLAGISLVGDPVKGQLVRFGVADGILRHFVHCHHAYLVPRAGAGLVVGSTMVWSDFDKAEDTTAIDLLTAQARRLLPVLHDAPVVETWTGLRPRVGSGVPVIQRVHDDVIIATGHFRNGILLTPITADAVAELAGGAPCGVNLSDYQIA